MIVPDAFLKSCLTFTLISIKMKILVFLGIFLIPTLPFAQNLNQKTTDPGKNSEMLIGYCNRDGFRTINSNFDSVYKVEYPRYHADEATMKQLEGKLKDIQITIVMATWCGDSKDWVPRFFKIMDELKFDYKNLTLICVDREKKAPGTIVTTLNIEKVPTFIFYREKVEIGRIIEVPADLLENDILKIVAIE
jgi:thiol-disulfide isomerase/thioredoxin